MRAGNWESYTDYVRRNKDLFPDVYEEEPEEDLKDSEDDTNE